MTGSLIIFLNRRCTVGCLTCNVAAAAVLPNPAGKTEVSELSVQWLERFFYKLQQEPLDFPGYVIWTGGEPFLSFDALLSGVSLASEAGYSSEILSSGIWFDQHPCYLDRLARFKDLSIRISLDAEHQQTVPVERIIRLIEKAETLAVPINFTLRRIPGSSLRPDAAQTMAEIKRRLPGFYRRNRDNSRWIHKIPHMPIRGATPSIRGAAPNGKNREEKKDVKFKQGTVKAKKACKLAFRDLVIGADGLAYPCCGFFGLPFHQRFALGDPLRASWSALAAKQEEIPFFRDIVQKGPYAMIREKNLEPSQWNWPGYRTPCDYCLALFTTGPIQFTP